MSGDDLDTDGLLLRESDLRFSLRALSRVLPRDLGLSAGGERLRTGLRLYPLARPLYPTGLRETLRLRLLLVLYLDTEFRDHVLIFVLSTAKKI